MDHAVQHHPMFLLHEAILEAVRTHRHAEHELAKLLARMENGRGYRLLGYASLGEYAQVALQLEPRKARALAQLARELPDLPVLEKAMREGALPWTKARELMRVVVPETQQAWLERAQGLSSRELERHLALCTKGDEPPPPGAEEKEPARRRVVFEMDDGDAQLLRDALSWFKSQLAGDGQDVEDGAVLAAMATRVLHDAKQDDPEEAPTGARYRKVLQQCPSCERTTGIDAEARDTVQHEACCDSEVLEMRAGPHQGHVSHTVPPSVRRRVFHRDGYRCGVPGCGNRLWLDLHHVCFFSKGGDHSPQNLLTLCSLHHRLVHEGELAVFAEDGGFVVEHADGRVAHVGQRSVPVWMHQEPKVPHPRIGAEA